MHRKLACFFLLLLFAFGPIGKAAPTPSTSTALIHASSDSPSSNTPSLNLNELTEVAERFLQERSGTPEEYAGKALELCLMISDLSSSSQEANAQKMDIFLQNELLNRLADSALTTSNLSLQLRMELLVHLSPEPSKRKTTAELSEWQTKRARWTQWMLNAWQEILKMHPQTTATSQVPLLNVALPDHASPDTITDPEERRKLDEAIARNKVQIEADTKAHLLQAKSAQFERSAELFLMQAYSRPPWELETIQAILEKSSIPASAKERILAAARKAKPAPKQ